MLTRRSDYLDDSNLMGALRVLAGGETELLRLSRDVRVEGARALREYAAVPSLTNPRILLPMEGSQEAIHTMILQYSSGAASRLARGAALLLLIANSFGLAPALLQNRLFVRALKPDCSDIPLQAFFARLLGRGDFVTGLRLAPGRPNSKPVAQVVSNDGRVLAYAKFGWDDLTRNLIQREAAVLRYLSSCELSAVIRIPEIIHAGDWNGLETLVLFPLQGEGRVPRRLKYYPVAASVALASRFPLSQERLGYTRFWRRTLARIENALERLPQQSGRLVCVARDVIERRWADRVVTCGRNHGDWIPPNILCCSDGIFNIWDWERSVCDAPLGLDAAQFVAYLMMRKQPFQRVAAVRANYVGQRLLGRLGLDPELFPLLLCSTLVESVMWYGEAIEAGRDGPEDRRVVNALELAVDVANR